MSLAFLVLIISIKSSAASKFYFYVVKKNDVISRILHRIGLKPIYEKNGSIHRLKRLNPSILDLNVIYPSQKIRFSSRLVGKGISLGLIRVTEINEIQFIDSRAGESSQSPESPQLADKCPKNPVAKIGPILTSPLSPSQVLSRYIAIGTGITFLNFSQNGNEMESLEYSSFLSSSFSIRGGIEWHNQFGIDAVYASYPGEINSSTNLVTNGKFSWANESLEATYKINRHIPSRFRLRARAGMQYHDLPYVQLPTASSADVRKHQIYMASIGLDNVFEISSTWTAEFLLRYQYPVSQSTTSDLVKFNNQFAFDGSIGANYHWGNHWRLGSFWHGQWQEFRYSMFNEAFGQMDVGRNRFFFSAIEFRMSFAFY
ncbi:MAG: LysM peptidoglycan-binding domain-containing protein [Bdellovibrionales bacterium]|nr:LysM peptidoglycan-binding domain-containing protein [Bdellovibrionales bacterium]